MYCIIFFKIANDSNKIKTMTGRSKKPRLLERADAWWKFCKAGF